jgi:hypothetical protein
MSVKGSKSRVQDKKSFDTNFDNIFRKKERLTIPENSIKEVRGYNYDVLTLDDSEDPKSLKNRKNLFLDDIRVPAQTFIVNGVKEPISLQEVSGVKPEDWVIVRNYEDFVSHIRHCGVPSKVSFDHDLCHEHMDHYLKQIEKGRETFDYSHSKVKTGLHCASYLIEYCVENNLDFPQYFIHTYNHIGYQNIKQEIEKYVH